MINRDIITVVINDTNSCYNKVIHVHCKNEKTIFNFCDFFKLGKSKLEEIKNIQFHNETKSVQLCHESKRVIFGRVNSFLNFMIKLREMMELVTIFFIICIIIYCYSCLVFCTFEKKILVVSKVLGPLFMV